MKITFSDNSTVEIILNDTPVANALKKMYRHLQHVDIPFRSWDNPAWFEQNDYTAIVEQLINFGKLVNVNVDKNLCLEHNQQYFNNIHKIYEQNYNGNSCWLDFHEYIHHCERFVNPEKGLVIDYREKSGLVEKSFDPLWISDIETVVKANSVYTTWAELGKMPYTYWDNKEPNDFSRICQLAKPWKILKPKIVISRNDLDRLPDAQRAEEFNNWWKNYEEAWCQHWNIPKWGLNEMLGVIVIGHVDNIELLNYNLLHNISPIRVSL